MLGSFQSFILHFIICNLHCNILFPCLLAKSIWDFVVLFGVVIGRVNEKSRSLFYGEKRIQ